MQEDVSIYALDSPEGSAAPYHIEGLISQSNSVC